LACWGIAVGQMNRMDMGTATQLGSFGSFMAVWVVMMAATMLPAAAPAVLRRAQASGLVRALYRPHGAVAAGAVSAADGVYEVTPLERHFRRRCREAARFWFSVRAVLRRVEHRADGGAGGAGSDEHHLDGGDRRARPLPGAAARQSRRRCAAGAGHRRAW